MDFAAVAAVATALGGGMSPLLAQVLPEIEAIVVQGLRGEVGDPDGGEGE